jgi:Protein of unknown function (DUF3738)
MKLLWLLFVALTVCAQEPVFDVASVNPSGSPRDGSGIRNQPGRFSTEYTTLAQLIQYAISAQDFQVVDGPGWIEDTRFDIVANFSPPDSDKMDITERIARIRAAFAGGSLSVAGSRRNSVRLRFTSSAWKRPEFA